MKIFLLLISLAVISCGQDSSNNRVEKENIPNVENLVATSSDVPEILNFEGQLFATVGVGGENTGYSIFMGGDRNMELDLATNNLQKKFQEYMFMKIKGFFKIVEGVEIPSRIVFEVTSMEISDEPHIE